MDIELALGCRIQRRRQQLGLTQKDLGQHCGITDAQIQRYEHGRVRLSAAHLWRLSHVLDVPLAYFFQDLERSWPQTETKVIPALEPSEPG